MYESPCLVARGKFSYTLPVVLVVLVAQFVIAVRPVWVLILKGRHSPDDLRGGC